jgi:xylitol oxidase
MTELTNWAGNIRFGAERVHRPTTLAQLQDVVGSAPRVRPLGTGHSFNPIADSRHDLVTIMDLPEECDIDSTRRIARVAGGMRYGDVAARLQSAGWALPNLGSLPHISVAGACATGTHGSGDGNGCLATSVVGLELVTAAGELAGVDDPAGAAVGLGALGVVTHLSLGLVPTFNIAQYVYEGVALPADLDVVDELFGAGYSVSLFTRWSAPTDNQVWLKRRADDDAVTARMWLGGTLADGPRHPIAGMPAEFCTPQLGQPGPWLERLPHFRPQFNPSAGDELQSEYLIPRERAVDALNALSAIGERIAAVLHVSELRTVAGDELWMSPAYRRDSLAVHFTWIKDTEAVAPVMAAVEERLWPLEARPHWGKLWAAPMASVAARYDRLGDFAALVRRHDPTGTFTNPFLDSLIGTAAR